MTIFAILFIICLAVLIFGIIYGIVNEWDVEDYFAHGSLVVLCLSIFLIITVYQKIDIKQEQIRYTKEREQIIYQIENMTEHTDKIKLNEWILSYNDWINDINTEKEALGWFAWHYYLDMTNHSIILLQ